MPNSLQANSFGAAAAEYERGRPEYPAAALDWLLPAGARTVLDLGAGTGKFTRGLLSRGLEVIAVEPSDGMRAELARALPEVEALAGSAEAIPLPDGAVDAVLVAQAWHWVDLPRAVPEVARVLAPGGQLGLVWNRRDERSGWTAAFGALLAGGDSSSEHVSPDPKVGPPFEVLERAAFTWADELTPLQLIDLAASRSYVITQPPAERAALLHRIQTLIDTDPELAGRERFELPYTAYCFRTHLKR
jgi:SAM-dependent methyltransferase